jgi:phosphohistidine phosphatase
MKLFFLRHGEAAYNKNDDIRELTQQGRDDVVFIAQQRRAALAGVQQVLVSPITRAQQTADIICREANINAPRSTVDWLIHETPLKDVLTQLAKLNHNALLVSHQPLAGKLVENLCGLQVGATSIGTANLIEMEGEAFISGALQLVHLQRP